MEPTKLNVDSQGVPRCPQCDQPLQLIDGDPIKIVEGKVHLKIQKHIIRAKLASYYIAEF